jgi:Tfp pilus assembly protein PilX
MNSRGFILIAGLVLLFALSLLGLVAASGMILQQHMASNFTQDAKALENSELAMSFARAWLYSRENHERQDSCTSDCLLPVAVYSAGEIPLRAEFEGAAWWRSHGVKAGINPITGESLMSLAQTGSEPPYWILEELHFQSFAADEGEDGTQGVGYYRILGRGTGAHPASVTVTESIIARPWGGNYQVHEFSAFEGTEHYCAQFDPALSPPLKCGRLAWRQRR